MCLLRHHYFQIIFSLTALSLLSPLEIIFICDFKIIQFSAKCTILYSNYWYNFRYFRKSSFSHRKPNIFLSTSWFYLILFQCVSCTTQNIENARWYFLILIKHPHHVPAFLKYWCFFEMAIEKNLSFVIKIIRIFEKTLTLKPLEW